MQKVPQESRIQQGLTQCSLCAGCHAGCGRSSGGQDRYGACPVELWSEQKAECSSANQTKKKKVECSCGSTLGRRKGCSAGRAWSGSSGRTNKSSPDQWSQIGAVLPQLPGDTWQCLETSLVIMTGWYLVGSGQGCCSTSSETQDSPTAKNDLAPMSAVPKVRNPHIDNERMEGGPGRWKGLHPTRAGSHLNMWVSGHGGSHL